MSKPENLMSPSASPAGVRRVNHLPLMIVIAAFTLFVLIIMVVAVKRSDEQHVEKIQPANKNSDTSNMPALIIGNRKSGIINAAPVIPIVNVAHTDLPPLPPRLANTSLLQPVENSAVDSAKLQEFENAVNAKSSIPYSAVVENSESSVSNENSGNTANRKEILEKMAQLTKDRSAGSVKSNDLTASYEAKLQHIHEMQSGSEKGIQSGEQDRWKLNDSLQMPQSPYEIRTGAVVPGIMISGINSELPGQIMGQVSQDIFDTATGKYLLIPMGTRLIGSYANNIVYGQSTVLIAWQRMIFPDGKALDIGAMPGADSAGYAGFKDQVNNHYMRIFGSAFLMSGITAGVALSQNQNRAGFFSQPDVSSQLSQALGQQLGQVTTQMIEKNLNISPTLEIRPGYRFNIIVVKDMTFPKPYHSFESV